MLTFSNLAGAKDVGNGSSWKDWGDLANTAINHHGSEIKWLSTNLDNWLPSDRNALILLHTNAGRDLNKGQRWRAALKKANNEVYVILLPLSLGGDLEAIVLPKGENKGVIVKNNPIEFLGDIEITHPENIVLPNANAKSSPEDFRDFIIDSEGNIEVYRFDKVSNKYKVF